MREGALREGARRQRRRRHGSVRGEGEWLACLVLMMCVRINGICARALAGSVQGVRRNGVTARGALKKPSVQTK